MEAMPIRPKIPMMIRYSATMVLSRRGMTRMRMPAIKQLVDHGWLHLWRWEGADLMRYDQGVWEPLHAENW